MDPRHLSSKARWVPRILITGSRPCHLSAQEAETWLASELRCLRAVPGVEGVVLTQVSAPPTRSWDWVCELHLGNGADAEACVEHPLCVEWLLDLRLLGMRPGLALLDGGRVVA